MVVRRRRSRLLTASVGIIATACLVACAALVRDAIAFTWQASAPVAASRPGPHGFVGHTGSQLTLDGHAMPLVGMNVYNAASTGACWYDMQGGDLLDRTFETIVGQSHGGANVVRVWFFQHLATVDGHRDWTAFDRVVATARAKGLLVMPVLGDQWSKCEEAGTAATYKDITWYRGGYQQPDPAGTVSYRDWVTEVVTRYRDDSTVAMWSLLNEAEARDSQDGPCSPGAAGAMRAFAGDMSALVKGIDTNHLLNFGTLGGDQCGTAGEDYATLYGQPLLDVCNYHDYDAPTTAWPPGLAVRLDQCSALGKPLLVTEAGINADAIGGVDRRADLFRDKLSTQLGKGIAGFLAWNWINPVDQAGDQYTIGSSDPVLPILGSFGTSLSRPDPASASEVPSDRPAMGWNPYNRFGTTIDERTFRNIVDAMVTTGMRDAGYVYANIDDGWQGDRDAKGNLTADARSWPSGIAETAAYVHARGLKLGIYTSPNDRSCANRTGSGGNAGKDVATFAGWGVDYIKLDWCGADYTSTGARAIAEQWRDAITASGRPMVLSINAGASPSVAPWAGEVVTSWRTTDDVCASWFNKTAPPAKDSKDCYSRDAHEGVYDTLRSTTSLSAAYAGPGHHADPDMLEVGNPGLTPDEAQTQFSLWAMWSAPLLAGHDPREMTGQDAASRVLLNRDVIAVDQDPLGLMATLVSDDAGLQVWEKQLAGHGRALLVVNTSENARDATVTLGAHSAVRDLWTGRVLGAQDDPFAVRAIPPHASVLLRADPQP